MQFIKDSQTVLPKSTSMLSTDLETSSWDLLLPVDPEKITIIMTMQVWSITYGNIFDGRNLVESNKT